MSSQADLLKALPGSTSPFVCSIAANRNMKSGGIGAGDFVEARRQYKTSTGAGSTPYVEFHVIPANPGSMTGVKVDVARLRKPYYVFNYTSTTHEVTNGVKYYVMRFPIWYAGGWRLSFRAGEDRGCFDVAFNPSG